MLIKTQEHFLRQALTRTNRIWYSNIYFAKLDPTAHGFLVRLKTTTYSRPGYRRTPSNRRSPHACWHVWGWFLDSLAKLDSSARYKDLNGKTRLVAEHGWEDRNIGSRLAPISFSDACDCRVVDKTTETSDTIRITSPVDDFEKRLVGPQWHVTETTPEITSIWIGTQTTEWALTWRQIAFVPSDFGEEKYNLTE